MPSNADVPGSGASSTVNPEKSMRSLPPLGAVTGDRDAVEVVTGEMSAEFKFLHIKVIVRAALSLCAKHVVVGDYGIATTTARAGIGPGD
jgi:hypothetical protein